MKLSRKKKIAREFLLLLSCVLISGLAFIGTYPYNFAINSKLDKLEKDVTHLTNEIDSLEKTFNAKLSKQKWFFNEWQNDANLADYENYTVIWERLEYLHKKDSIEYKWNNVWAKTVLDFNRSLGFKNPIQFEKFINDNSLNDIDLKNSTKVSSNQSEVNDIKLEIRNKKNKILDIGDQLNFALLFLVIAGIIAFPVRFLFYSIKWSIKTLKQKE